MNLVGQKTYKILRHDIVIKILLFVNIFNYYACFYTSKYAILVADLVYALFKNYLV